MEEPLTRITTRTEQPKPGFRIESKVFKPPSESISGVRTIAPDSADWQELGIGKRLGIAPFLETLIRSGRARLVFTSEFTSTCEEKAAAAGIPVESTIKAIYCSDVFSKEKFILVVSGKGKVVLSGALSEVHDYAQLEMSRQEELPAGMQFGTCTPFVSPGILGSIEMVALEDPATKIKNKKGKPTGTLGDCEADISIGGVDSTSHHLSVRMRYGDFVEALVSEYGDKAVITGFRRC
jgi:hypothetical protein